MSKPDDYESERLQQTENKAVLKELESERLKKAITNSPVTVYGLDCNLRYKWVVNPKVASSEKEMIGKKVGLTGQVMDVKPLVAFYLDVLKSGKSERRELRLDYGNQFSIFDVFADLEKNEKGEVTGLTATSTDITERKKAEELLKETEHRLRIITDNSRDGINLLDLKTGKYVYMNPAQVKLTGFTAEEINNISAKEAYERTYPDDREITVNQQKKVATGEADESEPVEYRWKVKSGEYRWFSDNRKLIRDENGHPIAIVGVSRDITERKKAEDSSRNTERLLNAVMDGSSDVIYVKDCQSHWLFVNPALERIAGKPSSELLGKNDLEIYPNREIGAAMMANDRRIMDSGKAETIEETIEAADGPRHFISEKVPRFDNEGQVIGLIGISRDVTERKKAEESMERQASLIDLSPDAIIVKNLDDIIIFWSKGAEQLYGWKKEEVIGKESRQIFKTRFPEPYEEILSQLHSMGRWNGEKIHTTKDGRQITVNSRWLAKSNDIGQIIEILETNEDITDRKKVEEELRVTHNRFYNSLSEMHGAILLVSTENKVEFANQAFTEIFNLREKPSQLQGVTAEEIIKKIKSGYVSPNIEETRIKEIVIAGKPVIGEEVQMTGGRTYLRDFIPLNSKGKTVSRLWHHLDITKQKMAEKSLKDRTEQLEHTQKKLEENAVRLEEYASQMEELAEQRANQLKDSERLATIGATAGMVGHDIRNPLQAITGDLYLAKTDLASIPESEEKQTIQESLTEIEKNIDYINKIVADLQDFARPLKPNSEETDLKLIIDQLLAKNGLPENVKVSVKVASAARKFVTDSTYINRIMYNLVNNAVQAMPKGGDLTIHAFKEAKDVVITVKDTGVGIPDTVKSKLFTPMFTTKSKGQGFGLVVIKRMTESLGGTVSFESQEGKGTTFIVRLPLKELTGK